MFLDGWKQDLLKSKVKNFHKNSKQSFKNSIGEGVGLLVDLREFENLKRLNELLLLLTESDDNMLIAFTHDKTHTEKESYLELSKSDFSISGSLKNPKIQQFIDKPFKVLISYYRTENVFLDFVSAQSKALFKVGISSELADFNDLTINSKAEEVQVFETELLKYLKLLNRID
ncbi:hypothetical protein DSM03_102252 [Leeuwenhoekiella aestuarii]|uniref:Uncharacterized protein n=1 Tax=Leeuwenhoekiella aestuarii TaxID=2249426 RepID=A0A4Q0NWR7_9FLAO|nr:hypothetical protein [Leeuwenhoekiella aestuarii]RXG15517.1 hypothetical protein DSM04_103406 [Leeuwenhoekiella aestuarii]RXG17376.1 hypothetical protein DSM03_102252 [Leeuwenhoekiella aestuarii]